MNQPPHANSPATPLSLRELNTPKLRVSSVASNRAIPHANGEPLSPKTPSIGGPVESGYRLSEESILQDNFDRSLHARLNGGHSALSDSHQQRGNMKGDPQFEAELATVYQRSMERQKQKEEQKEIRDRDDQRSQIATLKRQKNLQTHQSQLAYAQQKLNVTEELAPITRDMIAKAQKIEAKKITEQTMKVLREFLPPWVFAKAPNMPKHKKQEDQDKVPNIVQQQVSQALASAEMNVYLSYIHNIDDKVDFLQAYSAIRKQPAVELSKAMTTFMHQEYDQLEDPKPSHKKKEYTDKFSNTYVIHEEGAPKYNVDELASFHMIELQQLRDEINALKASIEQLRTGAEGNA